MPGRGSLGALWAHFYNFGAKIKHNWTHLKAGYISDESGRLAIPCWGMNGEKSGCPLYLCGAAGIINTEEVPLVTDQEIALRILCSLFGAVCIINIFARVLGEERKKAWFRVRSDFSFFNMRGIFGRSWLFGRPQTIEGVGVALAMFACIAAASFVIFIV